MVPSHRCGRRVGVVFEVQGTLFDRGPSCSVQQALSGRMPPRPGVARLLRQLSDAGAELHAATAGGAEWVRPLLASTFGPETFDIVICGDDVLQPKPSPETYLQLLAGTGLDPGHLIAVEDSWEGFVSARSAGLACAVVTTPDAGDEPFTSACLVRSGFEDLSADLLLGSTPCQRWRLCSASRLPVRRLRPFAR